MTKPKEKITAKTCLTCGACCVAPFGQDVFCNVTEEDSKLLGKKFVRLHVWQPSLFDRFAHAIDGAEIPWGAITTKTREQKAGPLKGQNLTACAMLEGDVLHKVSCKTYEKRPAVCHTAVVPGDKTCRWIREKVKRA